MRTSVVLLLSFLSGAASGQNLTPGISTLILPSRGRILHQPFSADGITTVTQTQPDGSQITIKSSTARLFRDSDGRMRVERLASASLTDGRSTPATIAIDDPVAGYYFILDTEKKVARRFRIPRIPGRQNPNPPAGPITPLRPPPVLDPEVPSMVSPLYPPPPRVKTENLGSQTILGFLVTGRRITVTHDADPIRNTAQSTTVTETWTSPEMQLAILSKRSDPRSGDTITKVENLDRNEPDATLFAPPADYKIEDMARVQ